MSNSEELRFYDRMATSPLFAEAIGGAMSISSAIEIAANHGFDVDESTIRAAAGIRLTGSRPDNANPGLNPDLNPELSDSDLEVISGGIDCGPISM
jgi:hypothetical protein